MVRKKRSNALTGIFDVQMTVSIKLSTSENAKSSVQKMNMNV